MPNKLKILYDNIVNAIDIILDGGFKLLCSAASPPLSGGRYLVLGAGNYGFALVRLRLMVNDEWGPPN